MQEKNSQITGDCLKRSWDCVGHKRFARILVGIVVFCIVHTLAVPAFATDMTDLLCGLDHEHDQSCYTATVPAEADESMVQETEPAEEGHIHSSECYIRERGARICTNPGPVTHVHTDACYELIEQEVTLEYVHKHTDKCYNRQQGALTCVTPEHEGHVHMDGCYIFGEELLCMMEESEEHSHEDSCYDKVLICETQENAGHTHADGCYEWEVALSCGLEEKTSDATEPKKVLICTEEEQVVHTHADACYEWIQVLSCGQEEVSAEYAEPLEPTKVLTCLKNEQTNHTHTDSCYEADSTGAEKPDEELVEEMAEEPIEEPEFDPTADVERWKDWEKTFAHVELTGAWSHDLLAIAQSQLGYEESARNFIISESGDKKGYTRYGDWYGIEYGDWCAMFASFCLHYAQIEDFPLHCNCARWIDILTESEMYAEADTCMPRPGDLVFIDYGRKSNTAQRVPANADHVAIVSEVIPATLDQPARIVTIEGNHYDCVCYETRSLEEPKIMGYGLLPDGPAASYSCNQETHIHESDCYDEEDNLICQTMEHIHDEICRSKSLQFVDESIQVDITLTNAVYVPEDLSLNVTMIPENEEPSHNAMMNALESAMTERSCSVIDSCSCRMELLADDAPYQLPIGVQANVQISFVQPVFGAEQVSNAAEIYTLMLVEEETGIKPGEQELYRTKAVFEDNYENAADGITGVSFSANHISEFAVVLADAAQESEP